MSIKDALVRQNNEDKILIGGIVKRVYNSQFGDILRAYIEGVKTKELLYHQDNGHISPDRILGRCEAYTNVIQDLERMIMDSEQIQEPLEEEDNDEIIGQSA